MVYVQVLEKIVKPVTPIQQSFNVISFPVFDKTKSESPNVIQHSAKPHPLIKASSKRGRRLKERRSEVTDLTATKASETNPKNNQIAFCCQLLRLSEELPKNRENAMKFINGNSSDLNALRCLAAKYLIEQYRVYIYKMAKSVHNSSSTLEDAYLEGCIGLLEAAKRFDSERGFVFITYAAFWIRSYISRYHQRNDRVIYLPISVQQWLSKTLKAQKENSESLLALEESPRHTDSKTEMLHNAIVASSLGNVSLEEVNYQQQHEASALPTSTDLIVQEASEAIMDPLLTNLYQEDIDILLKSALSQREIFVLKSRFGLDQDKMSRQSIGKHLSVSKQRIEGIEKRAIQKLRHFLAERPILRDEFFLFTKENN